MLLCAYIPTDLYWPSISKSGKGSKSLPEHCSPLFARSLTGNHIVCTRQHVVRSLPSSLHPLNSAYLFHEENILMIQYLKIWVSWVFNPLLITVRETHCLLMLPAKIFSACQREIKLSCHWCLTFHVSIQYFTGSGTVQWCLASSGVVVIDCEVRVLDLERVCTQALNFYHACFCPYYLINRLLRS